MIRDGRDDHRRRRSAAGSLDPSRAVVIEQGDLDAEQAGRTYLIRAESVADLSTRRARGRSLSTRMSWAVLLSDLGRTNWTAPQPRRASPGQVAPTDSETRPTVEISVVR